MSDLSKYAMIIIFIVLALPLTILVAHFNIITGIILLIMLSLLYLYAWKKSEEPIPYSLREVCMGGIITIYRGEEDD